SRDWSSDVCSSDLGVRRPAPRGDLAARVLLQHLPDEGAGVLPLVLPRHRREPVGGVEPALLREPVPDLLAETFDEPVVHLAPPFVLPPAGRDVPAAPRPLARPPLPLRGQPRPRPPPRGAGRGQGRGWAAG